MPMPMMRLSESADRTKLTAFCGDSLCGAYILCRYSCYGNDYPFVRCYIDRDSDTVRTAISVLEGTAVLLTSDATDYEELAVCLPLLGVRSVMTDEETAQKLPFPCTQTRQALRFDSVAAAAHATDDAPLRDVYDLIAASIPNAFPKGEEAYLHFLSDFTFRRNRGCARLKAVLENDTLTACALTVAETETAAVISGVACRADCRGKGFGKTVVSAMLSDLQHERKTPHVIALNDNAIGFYKRLGFHEANRIVWLTIE